MHGRLSHCLLSFVLIFSLAACGGGGGGGGGNTSQGSSSSPRSLSDQSVTFLFLEVRMIAGDTFGNIASAQGSGAITYTSSDTNVATVDESGRVTARNAGSTTITASVAADPVYRAASGSYTLIVKVLENQTLIFDQAGPLSLTEGDVVANIARGVGSGSVTYRSENPDIAVVDSEGYVTALAAGSTVITAKKWRDEKYYEAEASYVINVNPSGTIIMRAWIGAQDTQLEFPASADGLDLYTSRSLLCDILDYLNCLNAQHFNLGEETLLDTSATLSTTGHYVLKKEQQQAAIVISSDKLTGLSDRQLVSYNGQLFLFGGHDGNFNWRNEVWSSPDGRVWTLRTDNTSFSTLAEHRIVAFNNKLWAIGGLWSNHSDIWSSTDGVNWTQEVISAPFSARQYHQIVSFDNQLWLVGGYDGTDFKNDVWKSADGINWSLANPSAAFVADRTTVTGNGFGSFITPDELIVFDNKLWLFRGTLNSNTPAELWSSADGISWEKVAAPLDVIDRTLFQVAAHKGRIFIIAGNKNNNNVVSSSIDGITWDTRSYSNYPETTNHTVITHNDRLISVAASRTMSSTDGITWKELTSHADFPASSDSRVTSFNNNLWVIDRGWDPYIWSSTDGIIWKERTSENLFSKVSSAASIATFNNKLWLIGGRDYDRTTNEVWSSTDGVSWEQDTSEAAFPRRFTQHLTVHNNQLWLYGGYDENRLLNDVWVSSDGINWTLKSESIAPIPRIDASFFSYKDRLWIVGGGNAGSQLNDVWSSEDGAIWVQETASAEFSPRRSHEIILLNDQLWLYGGDTGDTFTNDIWRSDDGVHWTEIVGEASFTPRRAHEIVFHKDKMFLIGGETKDSAGMVRPINDVWSSTDGIEWRLGFYENFRFAD